MPMKTTVRFCARHCAQRRSIYRRRAVFQQRAEKIQGLPNNRTNEMIRGCEIRSISSGPASGPLHDDPMERRLVMHGF
jgi:hypothetical protein